MSTNTIDYDALAQKHGAAVDYDALASQHGGSSNHHTVDFSPVKPMQPMEDTGVMASLKRTGTGLVKLPGTVLNAITTPAQTPEEMAAVQHGGGLSLAINRLVGGPMIAEHEKAKQLRQQAALSQMEGQKDVADNLGHQANMHDIGSVVPVAGPMAANIVDRYGRGDTSGAATDLGTVIAGPEAVKGVGKVAGKVSGAIGSVVDRAAQSKYSTLADKDLLGLLSPRALHGVNWLKKATDVIGKVGEKDSGGLSDIVDAHAGKISELKSQLNDALSKANALPPEGPTAKLTDVPDLRAQASQQAPQNLLDRPPAPAVKMKLSQGGEFQVTPQEGAVTPSGKVTPDMEIYKEPDIAPKVAAKKPSLIDQMREWDNIRKIHSQLEDQIGKGQEEVQRWMEDHNQAAPGGAASTAKARFQAARAKAEGKANAIPSDAPTVAYRVRDAGETGIMPKGHAQATTDLPQAQSYVEGRGSAQNATQEVVKVDLTKLNPKEYTLKTGPGGKTWVQFKSAVPESYISKVGDEPQLATEQNMEELLMKSLQNARKAKSAKAGD